MSDKPHGEQQQQQPYSSLSLCLCVSVCYIVRHLLHFGRQLGTEKRGLLGWSSSTVAGFNQGAILTSSSPFPPALAACRMPPAANQPTKRKIYTHTHSQQLSTAGVIRLFFKTLQLAERNPAGLCAVSGYDMLQLHIYKFTQYVLLLLGLSVIFQNF